MGVVRDLRRISHTKNNDISLQRETGAAGAGPGLSAGPVVATGARPAGAPKSQGTRDPNSKFTDDEVRQQKPNGLNETTSEETGRLKHANDNTKEGRAKGMPPKPMERLPSSPAFQADAAA